MVNEQGIIIYKLGQMKGKEENTIIIPIRITIQSRLKRLLMYLTLDIGVENDFPEQLSSLPLKKRNQELPKEEKEYNKNHSKKGNNDRVYHL